jgi:hypothetical protein
VFSSALLLDFGDDALAGGRPDLGHAATISDNMERLSTAVDLRPFTSADP